MPRLWLKVTIIGVFCLPSLPSVAQTAPQNGISLERVMKSGARQFDKLDTNHDGLVDEAEWRAYVEEQVTRLRARLARRWSETDSNVDGKVSKEEFLNARAKWFAEVDTDKSGMIDSEKIRRYNYRRARTLQQ